MLPLKIIVFVIDGPLNGLWLLLSGKSPCQENSRFEYLEWKFLKRLGHYREFRCLHGTLLNCCNLMQVYLAIELITNGWIIAFLFYNIKFFILWRRNVSSTTKHGVKFSQEISIFICDIKLFSFENCNIFLRIYAKLEITKTYKMHTVYENT